MNLIRNVLTDVISRIGPLWASLVRTYVPMVLGAAFGWLASQGITLPEWLTGQSEATLIVLGMAAWYALARVLEVQGAKHGWSWMVLAGGIMNGLPKPPEYTPAAPVAPVGIASVMPTKIDRKAGVKITLTNGLEEHHPAT